MHDNVAADISSGNLRKDGADSPKTLVGETGTTTVRQWVVVTNVTTSSERSNGTSPAPTVKPPLRSSVLAFLQGGRRY